MGMIGQVYTYIWPYGAPGGGGHVFCHKSVVYYYVGDVYCRDLVTLKYQKSSANLHL